MSEVKENNFSIFARDAQEGKTYLTPMGKKITIKSINRFEGANQGEDNVSSVSVLLEDSTTPIAISGGTELHPFDEQVYKVQKIEKEKPIEEVKEKSKPTKSQTKKEVKMPEQSNDATTQPTAAGPKMSDIINPMIFEGVEAEKIADAVIAQFPEKTEERAKLIQQIKGPRTYNLKKKHPEKFIDQGTK